MIPETSNLKACPFCGKEPELIKCSGYDEAHCINDNCELSHTHVPINLSRLGWQSRPIEDALTARIAELEERVARLEQAGDAIASAVVATFISVDREKKKRECQLCENGFYEMDEPVIHTTDCPVTAWLRAKEEKE